MEDSIEATVSGPAPRHPLAYRDYRLFWVVRFAGVIATMSIVVVLGWQVYDIARSDYGMSRSAAAFQLGILGFVQFVPLLLLTPVSGLIADRFDRRRVAAIAIGVDMLVATGLGLATYYEALSLPLLFLFAALHGVARIFFGPAMSSLAPNLVPAPVIPRAIAVNSLAWQFASILGPAVGGLLYAVFPSLPYIVAVGLMALSVLLVSLIRPVRRPDVDRKAHPWRQIREGFSFVWKDRFLLGAISLDLFAVLLGGVTALLPVFARDILEVGPVGLGWMRAAPGIGAGLVALWLAVKPLEKNVGVKMLIAVGVYGLATAAFGFSRELILSLCVLIVLGAADMISVFVRTSLIQLNTPDAMRGRVSSISGLAISASNELGELQSGIAAALLGATGAVVFGGAGAILVTVIWAFWFPELKNARTFAPVYRE
ncbi:MFS transporter [Croceicoccus naphthovorans]|uniref:Multidrug efflux pump Tap n=1 Tax=Croceicoccus naphthovorans TaxID=1348774 RepID=A0A0G3XHI5_9SPHN|nr:MFS transporter [Croceicoccus naphthovorans]AKM10061.1 MFS transporter [Croceicoccus naphthovorans]MBB3991223.1 MFS family permease [Croceicoccus naphthovorans]